MERADGANGSNGSNGAGGRSGFLRPPVLHNDRGEIRKAGFEFEFAGITLELAASLVRQVFGGEHVVKTTFAHRVTGTRYGDFGVAIDSTLLKEKQYEVHLRRLGLDVDQLDTQPLEKLLMSMAAVKVPYEIEAPPIPVDELDALERLRRLLYEHHAEGTGASLLYSFGLHINAEAPRVDAPTLLSHLRAFLLLYPWLQDRVHVDLTRKLSTWINPFPAEYARLVLAEDYPAAPDRLIDDYLAHNPSRNRPLDMLPVLACLDERRVMARVQEKNLVKPRPAFHYRMPNCLIDEPDWRVSREWNTWVGVERLANDPETLARLCREYLEADGKWFKPFYDPWPDRLEGYVGPMGV